MKDKTFWSLLAFVTLTGWNVAMTQEQRFQWEPDETLLTAPGGSSRRRRRS